VALLTAGAEVNHANNKGKTALYVAAKFGHLEAMQALLTAGANVNHASNTGKTALYVAAEEGYLEAI
jgi:ankyrin repeat protein